MADDSGDDAWESQACFRERFFDAPRLSVDVREVFFVVVVMPLAATEGDTRSFESNNFVTIEFKSDGEEEDVEDAVRSTRKGSNSSVSISWSLISCRLRAFGVRANF